MHYSLCKIILLQVCESESIVDFAQSAIVSWKLLQSDLECSVVVFNCLLLQEIVSVVAIFLNVRFVIPDRRFRYRC